MPPHRVNFTFLQITFQKRGRKRQQLAKHHPHDHPSALAPRALGLFESSEKLYDNIWSGEPHNLEKAIDDQCPKDLPWCLLLISGEIC